MNSDHAHADDLAVVCAVLMQVTQLAMLVLLFTMNAAHRGITDTFNMSTVHTFRSPGRAAPGDALHPTERVLQEKHATTWLLHLAPW